MTLYMKLIPPLCPIHVLGLEKCSWFESLIISGMIWHKTVSPLFINNLPLFLSSMARISLFAQSKDAHLSSRRTASYFIPCLLGSRTKFSIFMENCSHFDWWNPKMSKTIREIPNCGAPAGCSTVVIVLRKERSASGEHQGKKSRFQFKRARKAAFLYRQWESGGKPFPFAEENNTCLAFSSWCIQPYRPGLIETGQNNELIILLWALMLFVQLNGWCNTSPCIHSICAYSLIVCHVAAKSKITIP